MIINVQISKWCWSYYLIYLFIPVFTNPVPILFKPWPIECLASQLPTYVFYVMHQGEKIGEKKGHFTMMQLDFVIHHHIVCLASQVKSVKFSDYCAHGWFYFVWKNTRFLKGGCGVTRKSVDLQTQSIHGQVIVRKFRTKNRKSMNWDGITHSDVTKILIVHGFIGENSCSEVTWKCCKAVTVAGISNARARGR